ITASGHYTHSSSHYLLVFPITFDTYDACTCYHSFFIITHGSVFYNDTIKEERKLRKLIYALLPIALISMIAFYSQSPTMAESTYFNGPTLEKQNNKNSSFKPHLKF